jgi:electron transport complex protein RnfC
MVLKFSGGVKPQVQSKILFKPFGKTGGAFRVGFPVGESAKISVSVGEQVARGAFLAFDGEAPIYSSVSGVFEGVFEKDGKRFLVVENDDTNRELKLFSPEMRAITDMDGSYISERARELSVSDSRSGRALFRLIDESRDKCGALVIDCTDPDPRSASVARICVEKAKSIVGGAKLLLHAVGASRCIFVIGKKRRDAFDSILGFANDKNLFGFAVLEEKYPFADEIIIHTLFGTDLEVGQSPLDLGILPVGAETVCALYDSFLNGVPHLDRYLTVCDGDGNGFNLRVPKGVSVESLVLGAKLEAENRVTVENSLVSGEIASEFISDGTRCIISADKTKKPTAECIFCGKCVSVCPVGLFPFRASVGDTKNLKKHCIACGCCEYVCPSGIELLSLIKNNTEVES